MNRKFNVIMLIMIIAQYIVPISLNASEITSFAKQSMSDTTSEVASDTTSDAATSDESNAISEIQSEAESSVDSVQSSVKSEEAVSVEVDSEAATSETVKSEAATSEQSNTELTDAQIAKLAKSYKPQPRETVLPNVEFNVLNMDAPTGYFMPEESTINGYSNGHNKISYPNGVTANIGSKGYVENYSNDPGTLQPDGTISRDTCGKGDDLGRFQCESLVFPLDTNLGGGEGSNHLGNESGIHSSDTIVMYYPEALSINGRLFDVKSKFSNFIKTSDSQGGADGGWYTSFALSHYFYDGYWLVDFQSVQQEVQISDSLTGEPLKLDQMKVYDFRFGMQSLNASGTDVNGEFTAEALQPFFGIDESTAVPTCDIENKYNYTLDATAWEGTSASECNGVSFNTTNTDTIEFRVAKNPSQADTWGNKYWEIAWFVPIFWATALPSNFTDTGDSPASYGNGEIEMDGQVDNTTDPDNPTIFEPNNFYLGDSDPLLDLQNDNYGHANGLNDDNNPKTAEVFDDETALDAYLAGDGTDTLVFEPTEDTITIDVPYTNKDQRDGQIAIWIDWDENGSYDQDEATVKKISGPSGTARFVINIPADAESGSTFLRAVITDSDQDLSALGDTAVFPGKGETEDYPLKVLSETEITKAVADSDGDNNISIGENVNYTITVKNISQSIPATDVAVRDSLAENLPAWLTWNDDVVVTPASTVTGSLETGDFKIDEIPSGGQVTIKFSLKLNTIPDGITTIDNIVTDNGTEPTVCDTADKGVDCDNASIGILGVTDITKAITNETGTEDGVAEYGEDITYQITVTNPTGVTAQNIAVKDSLVSNPPAWMTLSAGPTINPGGTATTGDLKAGTYVVNQIPANSNVTITYTMHINDIPTDVNLITNMATDNGTDPNSIDPDECTNDGDCAITNIPPETIIDKKVTDASGDNKLSVGEEATYTISVTNPANMAATNVPVRDSLYEAISNGDLLFVSIVNEPTLNPNLATTGDLADGTLKITNMPADSSVDVTFTIKYDQAPAGNSDITQLVNIATDNGVDPNTITDPDTTCPATDDDCATAVIPLLGDTTIDKAITAESKTQDGIAEKGEKVTYTLTIQNNSSVDALNVPVRDNVLESVAVTPWLDLSGAITVNPGSTATSGNLTAGDFVIADVPANSSVTITYKLEFGDYGKEITELVNRATDNGQDPDDCPADPTPDCDEARIDTNPPTEIDKKLIGESENVNGIFEDGENLTYELTITNSTGADAINVPVRDNLLEDLPTYFTWDGTISVNPGTASYTGDLGTGTFVLDEVPANSSVTITYTIDGGTLPDTVTMVGNIATDNGSDPVYPCSESSDDCSIVINPTEPETLIYKDVVDESKNGVASVGEKLTYTVEVKNPTDTPAPATNVRDSLIEDIANGTNTYLTYNGLESVKLSDGSTLAVNTGYTGDLSTADMQILTIPAKSSVFITYSVTVDSIPNDQGDILNVVTDDGTDPTECTQLSTNCSGTLTPLDPETIINKKTNLADGEAVGVGDQIEYTIEVTNPNTQTSALNVQVQDSLLQNIPTWLTIDSINVNPTDTLFSGQAKLGNVTIRAIEPGQTVTIKYVLTVKSIPDDISEITNIATDNGTDPGTLDPATCDTDPVDCGTTTTPVDPDTIITKKVEDANGNGIVESGEDLNYTIDVSNPGSNTALDVSVIDTLVDQITPGVVARVLGDDSYLTYVASSLVITMDGVPLTTPDDYVGKFENGTLVINQIPAGKTVQLKFKITVDNIPDHVKAITNVATDNGDEVETCTSEDPKDCATAVIPTNPKTLIGKTAVDDNNDKYVSVGEKINYSIKITNPSALSALNVSVRDSILENRPAYLGWDGNITVTPGTAAYTGSLADGSFKLTEVPANSSVTITYSLTLLSNPTDGTLNVLNMATDNGTDPGTITPQVCAVETADCDIADLPIDANTVIRKELIAQDGADNGAIEDGELLTYQIKVNNPTAAPALKVQVKDNLISNLPTWLKLEGGVTINPNTGVTGDLTTTNGITIATIPAGATVTITYKLRVGIVPNDVSSLINKATDNGVDPNTIDPALCQTSDSLGAGGYADDCGSTVNPIHPETVITKAVNTGADEYVSVGEELMYTITVTNPSVNDATNVNVIDSLYSNLPGDLQITTPYTVSDDIALSNVNVTGDLGTSDGIVIDNIPAGKTVTITYGLTLITVPLTGSGEIQNIVTDDGSDPTTCTEVSDDCADTVTPIDAETVVSKKLIKEDGKLAGFAESGETLTYEVDVKNLTASSAEVVAVRDSIAEQADTLDWVTYNGIVATSPEILPYTGDLAAGTLTIDEILPRSTVKLYYTITLGDIPTDVTEVANIVTDNNQDPTDPDYICTDNPRDCDDVIIPVNPETVITKGAELVAPDPLTGDVDNALSVGDTIQYSISVENPSTVTANDVVVIDSLMANLPSYMTLVDDNVQVISNFNGELVENTDYSGDLTTNGGLVINSIAGGDRITIVYKIHLDSIPDDGVVEVPNIATDNGDDPTDPDYVCDEASGDCGQIVVPLDADTKIEKSLVSDSIDNDGVVENGEQLTYAIKVINPSDANADMVAVRDSLLEAMPVGVELVGEPEVAAAPTYPINTTGSLTDGDFVITQIPGKTTVTITYTILVNEITSAEKTIPNVATDNGQDPVPLDPDTCNPTIDTNNDCSSVVVPTNPETTISKSLVNESIEKNTIAEKGEVLTYQLKVTNPDAKLAAKDVAVRDSLYEKISDPASAEAGYLSVSNITIKPATITTTGNMADGTFVIDKIPAGTTVTIDYNVTVNDIPKDVTSISNIATDTPQDPTDPDTCIVPDDCDDVIIPTNPDTIIEKSVNAGTDGIAQVGEKITFKLKVSNLTAQKTANIPVKDSLVEQIANGDITWLKFNNDTAIKGVSFSATASGQLTDGSYKITSIPAGQYAEITYSVTLLSVPDDISSVDNIATDNGDDPLAPDFVCTAGSTDCDNTSTPVEPDTIIHKTVTDTNDGIAQKGEPLTYQITVENTNDTQSAYKVLVRDGLFENLPRYMDINSVTVDPSTGVTGDIQTTGIKIAEIPANSSVTITVVGVLTKIPNRVDEITNIATDDGTDPDTIDPEDPTIVDPDNPDVCIDEDCGIAVIPVDPETIIKKSIANEDGKYDGVIEDGETVTYELDLRDPGADPTYNVPVRDSIIENLPSYAKYNDDIVIKSGTTELVAGTDYSGDLDSGDLVINEINRHSTVTVTYSVTYTDVPEDISSVTNLATDNGDDPNTIDPETCAPTDAKNTDCSEVTIPVDSPTVIDKAVVSEDGQAAGVIEDGETVGYQLKVTNPSPTAPAVDVNVRDNMLENIPDYVSLVGEIVVDPNVETSGSLQAGDFTISKIEPGQSITITYSLKYDKLPDDVTTISNMATDSGLDPETCPVDMKSAKTAINDDCATVVTPVEADTTITKAITSESGFVPEIIENGEIVSYQLAVTNPSEIAPAVGVSVRDNLLENLPVYAKLDGSIVVSPNVETTGSLLTGDFNIAQIDAGQTITISYKLKFDNIPSDVTSIANLATDNGQDPETCPPVTEESVINDDCSSVVIPVEGDTVITKAITNEDGQVANIIEDGETVSYQLSVTNTSQTVPAAGVVVRDSILENLPDYAKLDGEVKVDPNVETTGSLSTGDFTILEVEAGQTVNISYDLIFNNIPKGIESVTNLASDSGVDPDTCPLDTKATDTTISDDCASVVTPVNANTLIEKNVLTTNKVYYQGDTIKYQLIVKNDTVNAAKNVPVRDSLLENTPKYLQYNNDVKVSGGKGSGDITKGTFKVDQVLANSSVTITYSLKLIADPKQDTVLNVVTDNGVDPNTVDPDTIKPDTTGNDDVDSEEVKIGVKDVTPKPSEDSKSEEDYKDMHIATTGVKYLIVVINLFLILLISMVLKRRLA